MQVCRVSKAESYFTIVHRGVCRLFFHSGNVLRMVVLAVTVLGRPDAQEKLERVAEIVAVVAVERVGAVINCELGPETDVDALAV